MSRPPLFRLLDSIFGRKGEIHPIEVAIEKEIQKLLEEEERLLRTEMYLSMKEVSDKADG